MADAEATARPRRKRLGEMLVSLGVVSQEQLDDVLARQRAEGGGRVGRLLVELGYATDAQICEAVAEQLCIPAADMVAVDVSTDVLGRVSRDLAYRHGCVPWFVEGRELYLIMADPTNVQAADAIAFHTGLRIKPVVAPEGEILAALDRFYGAEEASLAKLGGGLTDQLSVVMELEEESGSEEDLEKAGLGGPVVKLMNAILADAIRTGASDIHVEPQPRGVELRYRVDGVLRPVMTMPKRVQTRVVSRIKIMSHMDISERRRPQDGRTFVRVAGKGYDLRVSTLPMADGEKAVLRILPQDRAHVALDALGFQPQTLTLFSEILSRPQGLILVTGPTGSGKTSTLYAALNHLRSDATNIVTVEDPIEYRLEGINQVPISQKSDLGFVSALRAILRQDPDVVMIGEIRDGETAQIAFQAAQTGHLVLSTLHTNDAPSTVTRLFDLGVPPYLIASSLLLVQAQRLVRQLCECRTVGPDGVAVPRGCELCRSTGFRGRRGVYELMRLTPALRTLVLTQEGDQVLRRAARSEGMRTMYEDGCEKAAQGLTTLEEVRRVVPPDEREETELAPSRAGRILVVDDDAAVRDALRDIIQAEGYEVVTAADGAEGLACARRERPSLILTDYRMPGMDGLALLRELRADSALGRVPVVLLSVDDTLRTELEALNLGADDYLSKPVRSDRLLGRIRRALFRGRTLGSSGPTA